MLVIACRRYRCVDCTRSFVLPLPGVTAGAGAARSRAGGDLRAPQRRDLCLDSRLAGVPGQATVARICAQFTERKARERQSLDCPRVLGIDEHNHLPTYAPSSKLWYRPIVP